MSHDRCQFPHRQRLRNHSSRWRSHLSRHEVSPSPSCKVSRQLLPWGRFSAAVVAAVAFAPVAQAEALYGSLRACLGQQEPRLVVDEVKMIPSTPRAGSGQGCSVKGHVHEAHGSLDVRKLQAEVRVEFCNRMDDCLLLFKKKGPLCKLANFTSCTLLKPGEEFVARPSWVDEWAIIRGSYNIDLRVRGDQNGDTIACYRLTNFIVAANLFWNRILDHRDALVAFGVAASASRALGSLFPRLSGGLLPQISGFLIIGVVVGPYVTNLVSHYHIFLMGAFVNRLSLSFIAGAAGAEIFLPELMNLIAPMMLQVACISTTTIAICTIGLLCLDSSALVTLPPLSEQKSLAAKACISLLAAALMTARSPASAIAVINEMNCGDLKTSKVILGITVLGDVVVLVLFALTTNLTRVVTEGGSFGLGVVLGVVFEIVASCILGAVASQVLRVFIPYKDPDKDHAEDAEQELTSPRDAWQRPILAVRGAILICILFATFMVAHYAAAWTHGALHLEPLLACTIASCICGHDKGRRHGLEEALGYWTPIVLLPFFTLAGASLQLMQLMQVLPAAFAIVVLRMLSIALGSISAGRVIVSRFPDVGLSSAAVNCTWLTLLAQAGVTLGLVLEVQDAFEGWGKDFGVLIIGVVVLNQLLGPVLCRVGLQQIVAVEGQAAKDSKYDAVAQGEIESGKPLAQEIIADPMRTISTTSRTTPTRVRSSDTLAAYTTLTT